MQLCPPLPQILKSLVRHVKNWNLLFIKLYLLLVSFYFLYYFISYITTFDLYLFTPLTMILHVRFHKLSWLFYRKQVPVVKWRVINGIGGYRENPWIEDDKNKRMNTLLLMFIWKNYDIILLYLSLVNTTWRKIDVCWNCIWQKICLIITG